MTTHTHPGNASAVADFLARTHLGPRQFHKNLDLWPILHPEAGTSPGEPRYVSLADAMASGAVRVDEIDRRGAVPHLRVTNAGEEDVLFLFGEEVVGAKQNRVANATFLVPAGSEIVIDVSCVEAGRWEARPTRQFAPTASLVSSDIRRKMAGKVSASRAAGGRFDADQSEVWASVGERTLLMGRRSPSDAYADYRESRRVDLEEIGRVFRAVEHQVGFVAAVGGEIAGLELIGRPEVFAKHFGGMLQAYALDAIDAARLEGARPARSARPRFEAPGDLVAALSRAPSTRGPSLGLGEDVRIRGEGVLGCGLVHEGHVVHLTAFPEEQA